MKFTSFLPGIGWLLLCTVLLCLPGSAIPKSGFLVKIYADKWVHIGMFTLLCLLLAIPFVKTNLTRFPFNRVLLITFAGIAYGALMELVQHYWVVNRSFEWADIGADTAGCLLGLAISKRIWDRRKKNWSR